MGLRIVKQILEVHNGTVEFELQKDVCRSVVLKLPGDAAKKDIPTIHLKYSIMT